MNIRKYFFGIVFAVLFVGVSVSQALAVDTTVVVTASDLDNSSSNPAVVAANGLNKWFMYNDTNDTVDNTLGSFVTGPGTPFYGTSSIQFTLGASPQDRKNIATYRFKGTALSTMTVMRYGAYAQGADPQHAPYLNFNVDFTGSSSAFQGRLVYLPSQNGTVTQNTWQTWDAINGGNALWGWSRYFSNGSKWPDNNTTQYRTWNDIKAAFPNARILPGDGWLGVRVGQPGPVGYTANVDFFAMGISGNTTTFDFDVPVTIPAAPTNLTGDASPGYQPYGQSITINWQDNANNETRYEVQYSKLYGVGITTVNLPANSTTFTMNGLSYRDAFNYRVRACNTAGCSAYTPFVLVIVNGL